MPHFERHTISLTTDSGGAVTAYTLGPVNGSIVSIQYVKTDFADGVDFTVTGETTGLAIWTGTNVNASTTVAPRQATHDTSGVASLYAAAGEPVEDRIAVVDERIKVAVASGGDTKTGTLYITTD